MHVVAVNGGPRKNFNTAALLQSAVDGAKSVGAGTDTIHLYDFQYKGCVSCFSCKRKDNSHHGHCAVQDALTPVLETVLRCDVLFLGSPIYLGQMTGATRCFVERLLFPLVSYEKPPEAIFTRSISTAMFFTMNMPKENAAAMEWVYKGNQMMFSKWLNGSFAYLTSYDTWQFDDYTKYTAKMFDLKQKRKTKEEQFPMDLKEAFEIGARLAGKAGG